MKLTLTSTLLALALSASINALPHPYVRLLHGARDLISTLESDVEGIVGGLKQEGVLGKLEGDGQLGDVVGEILEKIDPSLDLGSGSSGSSSSVASVDSSSSTSVSDSASSTSIADSASSTSLADAASSTTTSIASTSTSNSTTTDNNSSGGAVTNTNSTSSTTNTTTTSSTTSTTPVSGLVPSLGSPQVELRLSDVSTIDQDDGSPCGTGITGDISQLVDESIAVPFTTGQTTLNLTAVALQNNASVIMFIQVDPSATGNEFAPLQVLTFSRGLDNAQANALANEAAGSTVELEIALPSSLKCTGGKNKDLCLLQETNNGGASGSSGNCVVLQQLQPGTPLPPPPSTAPPPPPSLPGQENEELEQKPLGHFANSAAATKKANESGNGSAKVDGVSAGAVKGAVKGGSANGANSASKATGSATNQAAAQPSKSTGKKGKTTSGKKGKAGNGNGNGNKGRRFVL